MRLLVDTSVLIDVLRSRRGRRELLSAVARNGHLLATSSINVAEVYAGMRPEEEERTNQLLELLDCYEITAGIARRAGKLKWEWGQRGKTLSLSDTIIAAVALQHQCALMTDNLRDFPMPELEHYPLPSA